MTYGVARACAPGEDVRVRGDDEVAPLEEQPSLGVRRDDLGPNDWQAAPQREHVLHDGLFRALQLHYVADLDHRVHLGLGEVALP